MAKEFDSIIYMRHISLEVIIPKRYVWQFMAAFGKKFAIEYLHDGVKRNKAVDNYYDHPNGWHVTVTIWEKHETKFYDFLKKFCERRKISFRDPRQYSEYEETISALNKKIAELKATIKESQTKG